MEDARANSTPTKRQQPVQTWGRVALLRGDYARPAGNPLAKAEEVFARIIETGSERRRKPCRSMVSVLTQQRSGRVRGYCEVHAGCDRK